MRSSSPRALSRLKKSLRAARADFYRGVLVAFAVMVPSVWGNSFVRGGELPSPLIAPKPVASSPTDFARLEIPISSPVIAPEPTELPAGTHSIYEQALLGEEAPNI